MADHEFGEFPHDWFSLHVEIPQHLLTTPASYEADDIIVHAITYECHGAYCLKGPHRDVFIREPQMGSCKEFDSGLEVGRDHCGGNFCPTSSGRFETSKRGVCGSVLLSEVRHATPQGLLWA